MKSELQDVRTARLLLRRWRESDRERVVELCGEEEFWRYPFGGGFDSAQANRWFDRLLDGWEKDGFGVWAAEVAVTGEVVGYVGLHRADWLGGFEREIEVGWRLAKAHWGNGYATEGGRAALAAGFGQLGLQRVISIYNAENVSSGRVMERLGMRFWCHANTGEKGGEVVIHQIGREAFAAVTAPR